MGGHEDVKPKKCQPGALRSQVVARARRQKDVRRPIPEAVAEAHVHPDEDDRHRGAVVEHAERHVRK